MIEDPIEDKTADLAAMENENEGIEFISILEEVPDAERETQKSSREELIHHVVVT